MNDLKHYMQTVFADSAEVAGYISIDWWQLCIALGFVLLAGVLSFLYKLRLEKDLVLGTVRVFAQLVAVGYLLTAIFAIHSIWLVLAMCVVTAWFATGIARRKVRPQGINIVVPSFITMLLTNFIITATVTGVIVQAKPWWEPQYFIPLGGMVAGNSMNALSIALERFFAELRGRRSEIETRLCLGATPAEACADVFRLAMRSGMLNSINAMMGVGLVSLPGMMTGQILAGTPPSQAIRYQIVIMLMITASAALSSFLALILIRDRCFSKNEALLRLDENAS